MTFGEYFNNQRIKTGHSLRYFCELHKLDPGQISRIENNIQAPSLKTVRVYAEIFNLNKEERLLFSDLACLSAGKPDIKLNTKLLEMFNDLRNRQKRTS